MLGARIKDDLKKKKICLMLNFQLDLHIQAACAVVQFVI